ncbi:MAG: hypothetical protein QXL17_02770 [Candidatus Thermoplasmatota archaeon]
MEFQLIKLLNEMAVGHGKVYTKVQNKLKKLGIDASIDAIRDFFERKDTPRCKVLVQKFEKLGYDKDKEWLGNESFFEEIGISKDDYMAVAKETNELAYEALKFGETFSADKTITEKNGCPTKMKKKEENEEHTMGLTAKKGRKVVKDHKAGLISFKDAEKALKNLGFNESEIEEILPKEEDEETRVLSCPVCKARVSVDEFEEHMEEHETKQKKPLKKMRREEDEEECPEEMMGDESTLPKQAAKEFKKKHEKDVNEKKFRKDYPVREGYQKTHLTISQKHELVEVMRDLLKDFEKVKSYDITDKAHQVLDDVAGFETASLKEKAKVVNELVDMYKKKYQVK